MARLNLAEALVGCGRTTEAGEQARRALKLLNVNGDLNPSVLEGPTSHRLLTCFGWNGNCAGWSHAGNPANELEAKRALFRWRLHVLLAELAGDLSHYYEAVLSRPDLPSSQAALGCALGRLRRFDEALPHLKQAIADNPFDRDAARALYQVLIEVGDHDGQGRLIHDRRMLSQAAPDMVARETWFLGEPAAKRAQSSTGIESGEVVAGDGALASSLCSGPLTVVRSGEVGGHRDAAGKPLPCGRGSAENGGGEPASPALTGRTASCGKAYSFRCSRWP